MGLFQEEDEFYQLCQNLNIRQNLVKLKGKCFKYYHVLLLKI